MEKQRNLRTLLRGLVFGLGFVLAAGSLASAAVPFPTPAPLFPTPRTVIIYGMHEAGNVAPVEPNKLWVDRFTEITWVNDSGSSIRIKFGKGTNCREVSSEAFPGLGIRLDPFRRNAL